MTNQPTNLPEQTPAPSVAITPKNPSRKPISAQVKQFINHPRFKTIITGSSITLFILVATSYFIVKSQSQLQFQQPPLIAPSPTPKSQTRFANDPLLLQIEASLASTSAQLKNLQIQNHPLIPPVLDMEVTLIQ